MHRFTLTLVALLLLVAPARGQDVPEVRPVAVFEGDGVTLRLLTDDAATGQRTGTIEFKGAVYPFTAVATAGGDGAAAGTFAVDEHRYSFNTRGDDAGRLVFATGSKRYVLEPVAAPADAEGRPTVTLGAVDDPAYQQLKQGAASYAGGEYKTAFRLIRPLAERGHVGAAYLMGLNYQLGRADAVDEGQAAAWYRLAADAGHPGAMYNLQGLLRTGRGVDADPAAADGLLREAAMAGYPPAMGGYGAAAVGGAIEGVTTAEGLAWLRLAAARGGATAAADLPLVEARATPEDRAEADRLSGALVVPEAPPDPVLGYHAYLTRE